MDNQTILAMSIAMERIEKRYPETYRNNKRWIKMNQDRENYCRLYAKQELEYHRDRFNRTGDIASKQKADSYERYLQKFESKGEKNGNTSVL